MVNVVHPLKMSVTNMTIRSNEVFVTTKLFADDFQDQMRRIYPRMDFKKLSKREKQEIENYYKKHFVITSKSDTLNGEIKSITLIEAELILQIRCSWKKEDNQVISIKNDLMMEAFSIQKNVILYKNKKGQQKLEFTKDDVVKTIEY